MKTKKAFFTLILLVALVFSAWAGGNKENDNKPQPQTQTQPVQQTVQQVAQPTSQYWTGDGGRGESITILPPKGTGLTENQTNLLEVIAVELVSNFTKYSSPNTLMKISPVFKIFIR
jgi:uncharacterized alpha/beta hydrolase family protein